MAEHGGGAEDPEARLQRVARELADAAEELLPRWVVRCVEKATSSPAGALAPDLAAAARQAGEAAQREVGSALRALLACDIDEQKTTPLALLRSATAYPTAVLQAAGVPPVERDEFKRRAFPEDLYDLCPASWADLDPALGEFGLIWSAAKAYVHIRRHRH